MATLSSLTITRVQLRVASLERALAFYRDLLGFHAEGGALSAAPGGPVLIELLEDPSAPPRPVRSVGLYHIAIRVPDRPALAALLRRLAEAQWPLQGAADHLVSDAIYLADPDGNGLELTADHPRDRWPMRNGRLVMGTERLDLLDLLEESPAGSFALHPATAIGHLHLQVGSLPAAERFYSELLGLDVVERSFPGALFMSAGNYHHHIGANTWAGANAPLPPAGSLGLAGYTLTLPDHATWLSVAYRAGSPSGRLSLVDPAGALVQVTHAGGNGRYSQPDLARTAPADQLLR